MKPSYTISVISLSGGTIRQLNLSKGRLRLVIALVILTTAVTVIGAVRYASFRRAAAHHQSLSTRVKAQDQLIARQRRQLQSFAADINALKNRIVAISDFEQKIRVIANLNSEPENSALFGVGGVAPEDLNTDLSLDEAHGTLIREMHQQANQLDAAAERQAHRISALLGRMENQIHQLAATPSIRPTKGWITSRFGNRTSPFTGQREFHPALDIANKEGSPLVATADGIVSFAGNKWLLGKVIVIDHGYGMVTRYAHCKKLIKSAGDKVRRGDVIAKMGNTGRSTGPHVHYEVRLNGVPVNPEHYILN
jgi:murein DD-endopeptidase MepM/ murein hydrolase activator NlpD